MIKRNYKKILIIGIFALLLGTAIAPNIVGKENIVKIISSEQSPTSYPLNDDFVNAFWQLDDCSGNVIEDTSAHSYDGSRYGATWITNGYSGCALDFDGVNDYVDLSDHSKKIGFNKSDDFIITFYFKTTGDGIIFSSTGYKNIPEFKIEILDNGSLQFKAWTTLCGMSVSTNGTYDDGSWHEVEIIYNGITTDPTVEIFIDNNLDNSLTDWLCDIESHDWLAAALGKRASDDTGYFDGIIDEFKFVKYEGGNEQESPEISGPEHGDPGSELEYTFITNDPEGDEVRIKIDWGDGEVTDWLGPVDSGEPWIESHSWDEEGVYYIKTKSIDRWHYSGWTIDGYEVKIGNQAPEKPRISGPRYGDPKVDYTYEFVADDFEDHDVKYVIDWDDGESDETDYYPANTSIQLSHSYENKGDYNITAYAIDEHGKPGLESEKYWIRIGDEPPRKPDIDGPIAGGTGTEVDFVFTADDPELDKVYFNIKWGDGEEILESDEYDSGEEAVISHVWERSGNFVVEARAMDMFGYWSSWESFEIKIPRTRSSFNLLEILFERFPNAFPIIRQLIGM
jgi:hypothetical protein